jgi:hypothetical protein
MTHWNFLRIASSKPRTQIDAAALAPVAPFALRRILF